MNFKNIITSSYYSTVMLLSVFLYAFLLIPFEGAGRVFAIIFSLGMLPVLYIKKKYFFKDPMMMLLGLAILSQIFSWCHAYFSFPDIVSSAPKVDRLAKLFLFVFIGYWLKGKTKNVYIVWILFLLGFTFGCFVHADFFHQLKIGLSGSRVDFGIKNAQFTTMFSGIGMLICGYFFVVIYKECKKFKYFLLAINAFAFLFFTIITVISQSRMVWLALLIVMFFMPIIYLYLSEKKNVLGVFTTYLIIAVVGLGISQLNIVKKRTVGTESGTFHHIIHGDFDNIPMTSIGIRVNSWLEASKWIKESPIFGADSNAIPEVIQRSSKFSSQLKSQFGHLHNFHIETLVAYGLFGLLVIYGVYFWLYKSVSIQVKEQQLSIELLAFCTVFILYWLVVNSFEVFNSRSYGVFAHNIMCATFYTYYLNANLNKDVSD